MGTPYRIQQSTSCQSPHIESAEFEALSLIAQLLAHPDRSLLSEFVKQATDRESAARFFLDEVPERNKSAVLDFLVCWVRLLRKVSPVIVTDAQASLKSSVWRRDGGKCCILPDHGVRKNNQKPLLVHILPPNLFRDEEMRQGGRLDRMLTAYIGEAKSNYLKSLLDWPLHTTDHDCSGQVLLLSPSMFEYFQNGRLAFKVNALDTTETTAECFLSRNLLVPFAEFNMFPFIQLENRAPDIASLPDAQLLEVHHRLAPALAWLEVSSRMSLACGQSHDMKSQYSRCFGTGLSMLKTWIKQCSRSVQRLFQCLWPRLPMFIRAFTYKQLASISGHLYGYTGSDSVYKLPFNHYLRIAPSSWALKLQAEFQTLRSVETYTRIPAPRAIDTLQYSGSSYLLMTGVPGRAIGQKLPMMTDEQLDAAAHDLKEYITELRDIPRKTDSEFQICNILGDGILDWRIRHCQDQRLRFHNEAEFHQYLTHELPLDEEVLATVSKVHGIKHDIVFTHADLNLRNILVDENNKISGIVDWECAGWYPSYWEYTKMHFTVRVTQRWIVDVVDQIFPGYRAELEVENMISSMLPSW